MRLPLVEGERAVREVVKPPRVVLQPLRVQPLVDRVRSGLAEQLEEADVVLATAERARAMPRRERCRLVEEEQLREPARLE